MRKSARLGEAVIVYDEGGNWRGAGTAWHLAEAGQRVTVVTPDPYVGREITRTSADGPLRQRLAQLGARMLTEHTILAWYGDGAIIRSLLDGREERVPAHALVMATTNRAFEPLSGELDGFECHVIGDAAAPRQAPYAFHEGRKVGLLV